MDVGALASAVVGGITAQAQLAVAARIVRMNAQAEASVAQLVEAAQRSGARSAAAVAGPGGNLDIVV